MRRAPVPLGASLATPAPARSPRAPAPPFVALADEAPKAVAAPVVAPVSADGKVEGPAPLGDWMARAHCIAVLGGAAEERAALCDAAVAATLRQDATARVSRLSDPAETQTRWRDVLHRTKGRVTGDCEARCQRPGGGDDAGLAGLAGVGVGRVAVAREVKASLERRSGAGAVAPPVTLLVVDGALHRDALGGLQHWRHCGVRVVFSVPSAYMLDPPVRALVDLAVWCAADAATDADVAALLRMEGRAAPSGPAPSRFRAARAAASGWGDAVDVDPARLSALPATAA